MIFYHTLFDSNMHDFSNESQLKKRDNCNHQSIEYSCGQEEYKFKAFGCEHFGCLTSGIIDVYNLLPNKINRTMNRAQIWDGQIYNNSKTLHSWYHVHVLDTTNV